MNPILKTDIILPYKERMTANNAGAISNVVYELINKSVFKSSFRVFGSEIEKPISKINYYSLIPKFSLFRGKNIGMALSYIEFLKKSEYFPNFVEVHNRSQVAMELLKKRSDLNVILYYHNDPRTMKGSYSPNERIWLLKHLKGIIFVSDYLKKCFLDGLNIKNINSKKLAVVRNGVEKVTANLKKQKEILIVGRMVREKGILEACIALTRVLPNFPEWKVNIVGARKFYKSTPSNYEKKIKKVLTPIMSQVIIHGHLPKSKLKKIQNKSMISIVPSLWEEPAGLTVLEALASDSVLITTNKGGIPEIAKNKSILIKMSKNDPKYILFIKDLSNAIKDLLINPDKVYKMREIASKNYEFTASKMATNADKIRLNFLN